jgi:hypothetical protein
MSLTLYLNQTATVYRPTHSTDPFTNTYVAVSTLTAVSCRVVPIDGSVEPSVMGMYASGTHVIYFDGDADVQANDVITVVSYTDRQFKVKEKLNAYAQQATPNHVECLVEEQRPKELA